MKNIWLCALQLVPLVVPLSAQKVEMLPFTASGNSFLRDCSIVDKEKDTTPAENTQSAACLLYVGGVMQGAELGSGVTRLEAKPMELPKLFCRPENIEMLQLVRIVLKYVRENPEKANLGTGGLIILALREAYPCPSK
jgi:hypothetical protein